MSGRAPVKIHAVHARILASSEHLDAMAKHLLISLGFTDDPALWPSEVERVLTDLAGSARLAAVQQICATAQYFREKKPEGETKVHLADIGFERVQHRTTMQVLVGLTSSDVESFDPECRNIIRSHLPELDEKFTAFDQDIAPLQAILSELSSSYAILATQRHELDAALNAWLRIEIPGELVAACKAAIVQLSTLADERRTIVDRAENLLSSVASRYTPPTQEDQARVYEEFRGLARTLAVQVTSHRLHLTAVANTVRTLRNELPAVRVRGHEVPVRDLLAVRSKHSAYEARVAAMAERSEHLRQMLGCMYNVLTLDNDLYGYKRASAQAP